MIILNDDTIWRIDVSLFTKSEGWNADGEPEGEVKARKSHLSILGLASAVAMSAN